MKINLLNIYLTALLVFIYSLFYLVPWAFVTGVIDIANVGLLLLLIGLSVSLFTSRRFTFLKNPFTVLIFLYLIFISIHVGLAAIHYDQAVIHGIIAVRWQFIYLSFFLFLFLLKDEAHIIGYLNLISVIAILLLLLSVIQYSGFPIFHHDKSEWESLRSGIRRVFIPGTPLIHLALIWKICCWVIDRKKSRPMISIQVLLLFTGMMFHQSRGPIIGILFTALVVFLSTRSYKKLMAGIIVGMISGSILMVATQQNLFMNAYSSTIHEVSEGSGTWGARLEQMKIDFEEFRKHPVIGSGLIAIRVSEYGTTMVQKAEMNERTRLADLGYTHWIKLYGSAGAIWIVFFLYLLWSHSITAFRKSEGRARLLSLFVLAYTAFISLTGITLEHFLIEIRIILVCLVTAILIPQGDKFRTSRQAAQLSFILLEKSPRHQWEPGNPL
ncbi:MAG: O-antigen ligase domain-containing protein [Desulfobacteraceae bacterium]|nr:MAG: O-antigen ligase domain-containing protein [Desulfobacteraceae bacterium]